MIEDVLKDAEERMKKAIEALKRDLLSIRTGRATPALIDRLPGRMGPVDHHQRGGRDPYRDHQGAGVGLGSLGQRRQPAATGQEGRAQPGGDVSDQQWHLLEEAKYAEHLGDQDQHRDADHDLRQARQCPRPSEVPRPSQ